jgi:hypothetical protein
VQNLSLEILLNYEYDTIDPKHNIKQIFICALAHKIIDTSLVFSCEPREEIFQISFCGTFEILC